jgi:hypothetical protein
LSLAKAQVVLDAANWFAIQAIMAAERMVRKRSCGSKGVSMREEEQEEKGKAGERERTRAPIRLPVTTFMR